MRHYNLDGVLAVGWNSKAFYDIFLCCKIRWGNLSRKHKISIVPVIVSKLYCNSLFFRESTIRKIRILVSKNYVLLFSRSQRPRWECIQSCVNRLVCIPTHNTMDGVWYGSKEGAGRVESGTETESNALGQEARR
jgi:hypothetical protein